MSVAMLMKSLTKKTKNLKINLDQNHKKSYLYLTGKQASH